jgi:hypothetical protein
MATQPASHSHPAANRHRPSMRRSSTPPTMAGAMPGNRFSPPPGCVLPHSVDLAGRSVALCHDIPEIFDAPLAAHHKLIGRWVAERETGTRRYSRPEARRRIEETFKASVAEILAPIDLVDLRVVVLNADADRTPAFVVTCDSMGQLDLGWIETSDAPVAWRAAAYRVLEKTLGSVLPVFCYDDLFDEIATYYWAGETSDEAARRAQIEIYGMDPEELDEDILPSAMNGRRPAWMIDSEAGKSGSLPHELRHAIGRLRAAHKAVSRHDPDSNAWRFELQTVWDYIPEQEECSSLPPMTLVPLEQFAREIDEIYRRGMEMGFLEIAGLCQLPDETRIDSWITSLRQGALFLLTVQELIALYPANQ